MLPSPNYQPSFIKPDHSYTCVPETNDGFDKLGVRITIKDGNLKRIVEKAVKAMLPKLDQQSFYTNSETAKVGWPENNDDLYGIGVDITIKDGLLTVVSPLDGGPAVRKGIKPGDEILRIGNKTTKDLSLMDAVRLLRGERDTKVTICVLRQGSNEPQDYTIPREVAPTSNIKLEALESGYVFAQVGISHTQAAEDLKNVLEKRDPEEAIKGLVLDFRDNNDNRLDQAIKISNLFLDKGVIVSTRRQLKGKNIEYKVHARGMSYQFPVVVLVNEKSGAAAEIVAGSLQDHRRALILGTPTLAGDILQKIIPMHEGVYLPAEARYYTPNGVSIHTKGIIPDVIVPARISVTDGQNTLPMGCKNGDPSRKPQKRINRDHQLHTALTILKNLVLFSGPANSPAYRKPAENN